LKNINKVRNFLINGHERSIEAKKNILISLGIKGFSILITLAFVPLIIDYISSVQYGIWLTLSSVVAWFSFFDIGLDNGMRNRIAQAKANNNPKLGKTYVSTTYAIIIITFTTIWLGFIVVYKYFNWGTLLNAPTETVSLLPTLALIVFTFFCLQMVAKLINSVLNAYQKPALTNFIALIGQFLAFIIVFILNRTTEGSIIKLGFILSSIPVFVLLISSVFLFNTKYKEISPSLRYIDFSLSKDLLSLGGKFFLIQISVVIVLQTTNIIITQTISPNSVTTFDIVRKYFFVMSTVFLIVVTPFWSAFTDAYVNKEYVWMRNVLKKLEKVWLILIPLTVFMILISDKVYSIWIGDRLSIPFEVSVFMGLYVIVFTRANLYMYLLNGMGKIRLQLFSYTLLAILFIPLAIILIRVFGLVGIIGANIIIFLLLGVISQIQVNKLLKKQASGIWGE
jgi:O-antigen/teichoic acid export membrane protein